MKTLHKNNLFNTTFLFESKKEPQNSRKSFQEKMCVKTKMFSHNNTFTPPHVFVKDKKDSATAGNLKIDKQHK